MSFLCLAEIAENAEIYNCQELENSWSSENRAKLIWALSSRDKSQ
jgi:hypothetical protein